MKDDLIRPMCDILSRCPLTVLAAAISVCRPLSTMASANSDIGILPLYPAAVYLASPINNNEWGRGGGEAYAFVCLDHLATAYASLSRGSAGGGGGGELRVTPVTRCNY